VPIYPEIYDGPPRWYEDRRTRKLYIMIHATANTASAENEAKYAKRRPDKTSSHYYVDDDSIVQSLNTDLVAYHAGSWQGNERAISYELTAKNMYVPQSWWLDLDNIEWPVLVKQVARDCWEHGIEPRNLTLAEIREGRLTGFMTHDEARRVWGGTTHYDPGPNFPMDYLVEQVRLVMGKGVKPGPIKPVKPPAKSADWRKEIVDRMDVLDLSKVSSDSRTWKRGVEVGRLQSLLAANGFPPSNSFDAKGRPDRVAGPATKTALAAFQKAKKTGSPSNPGQPDYVAGKATWGALLN
jgi:hypothetical protein